MEFIAKIFDITKLPSKVVAWLALLTGSYVLLPDQLLNNLYLDKFPSEYKPYAGAAFVATSTLLAINVLLWFWHRLLRLVRKRHSRKAIQGALAELDWDEIAAIREFFIQRRHVIELPVDHPVIAGLRNKHLVQVAGATGYRDLAGRVHPMQLNEYAKGLITFELLGLPDEPTEEDLDRIRSERPNYIRRIERNDQLRGGFGW